MQEISFGTDGWRGIIGDTYTFKNVGWFPRRWRIPRHGEVAGCRYDTRFLSDRFARISAEVIAGTGYASSFRTGRYRLLP